MADRRLLVGCLLLTVSVAVAMAQLRAAWDVAYARRCSERVAIQTHWLWTNETARGSCPELAKLDVAKRSTAPSPGEVAFVGHGLLCTVERDRIRVPCDIMVRIGQPVLLMQVITIPRDGPLRLHRPRITGGVLRSLRQTTEVRDD